MAFEPFLEDIAGILDDQSLVEQHDANRVDLKREDLTGLSPLKPVEKNENVKTTKGDTNGDWHREWKRQEETLMRNKQRDANFMDLKREDLTGLSPLKQVEKSKDSKATRRDTNADRRRSHRERKRQEETLVLDERHGATNVDLNVEDLPSLPPVKPLEKSNDVKTSKRDTNADRCRRHRERKRQEETLVRDENVALKRERAEMLDEIAELELQAQTLLGQGCVSYELENYMLRKEIKKHRIFVAKVMQLAKSDCFDTFEDENLRVMHCTCESAIAQMIGLSYSSMVDPTWHSGQVYSIALNEEGTIKYDMACRYQCLPLGSTPSTAVKINVRFDLYNVPLTVGKICEFLHVVNSDVSLMREYSACYDLYENLEVEEVSPYRRFGDTSFGCIRFSHTVDGTRHTATMVSAFGTKTMNSRAFPSEHTSESGDADIPVKVQVSSSLGPLPSHNKDIGEDDKHGNEVFMTALFMRDFDALTESSNLTSIGTAPAQTFNGLEMRLVEEDGSLNEKYLSAIVASWQNLYKKCKDL